MWKLTALVLPLIFVPAVKPTLRNTSTSSPTAPQCCHNEVLPFQIASRKLCILLGADMITMIPTCTFRD